MTDTPLAKALEEARRDRAERADPGLAPLVNARDHQAAAGQFTLADASQRLIDAERDRAADRDEGRTTVCGTRTAEREGVER